MRALGCRQRQTGENEDTDEGRENGRHRPGGSSRRHPRDFHDHPKRPWPYRPPQNRRAALSPCKVPQMGRVPSDMSPLFFQRTRFGAYEGPTYPIDRIEPRA